MIASAPISLAFFLMLSRRSGSGVLAGPVASSMAIALHGLSGAADKIATLEVAGYLSDS
jgi:hypothetical protein